MSRGEQGPRKRDEQAGGGAHSLPRLVLVADGFTEAAVAGQVVEAVEGGVPWVQLRDHAARDTPFREAARSLAEQMRRAAPEVLISVNSRLAVARRLGVGLHTGRHGPTVEEALRVLGREALVGCSVHDLQEAGDAAGSQYFFFSPVFPTASKPGHPGTGLEALRAFTQQFPDVPTFALGGITPERAPACLEAGARGVAVLSGLLYADDPARTATRYLHALSDT